VEKDRRVLLSDGDRPCWYAGALGLVLGGGGVGKSRWVKALAVASITSREFCGFRTHERGTWLFLNAEDDQFRAQADINRFVAGFRLNEVEQAALEDRLLMTASNIGRQMPPTDLSDPTVVISLRTLAERHQPAVVVVDPWESFVSDGDANDAAGTRRSLQRLQAIFPKSTLLVVHHSREGAEATKGAFGFNASAFSKGSKTAMTRARFVINITARTTNLDTATGHGLVISCGKSNDTEKFAVRAVALAEEGVYRLDQHFDVKAYLDEVDGRRKSAVRVEDIVALVENGTTKGADIAEYFEDRDQISRTTTYRILGQAVKQRRLTRKRIGTADHYAVPGSEGSAESEE
jgi:hypothetical protein